MKRRLAGLTMALAITVTAMGMGYGPYPNLPEQASAKAHASYASVLKGLTSTVMPEHVSPQH